MKIAFILLKGGLGNQLFIYSFMLWLQSHEYKVIVDDKSGFKRDKKYRRNNNLNFFSLQYHSLRYSLLSPFRYFTWKVISIIPLHSKIIYRFDEGNTSLTDGMRMIASKQPRVLLCNGYFQKSTLAEEFEKEIYHKIQPKFVNLRDEPSDTACMHVRFFDQAIDGPNNVPIDFYQKAVRALVEKKPNIKKLTVLVEKPLTLDQLNLQNEPIEISVRMASPSQFDDFIFLASFCNLIISNSTFSYWAAMLNSEYKTVIAPSHKKRGEGSWGGHGLLPYSWIKIQ